MTEYLFPVLGGVGSGSGGTAGSGASSGVLEAALAQRGATVGLDVLCHPDLDPQLRLVGGFPLLAQDLLNRLSTPRGGLFYDPSYGYDLRALLCRALDERDVPTIAALIEAQCLLDERVASVSVAVTLLRLEHRLRITLTVETDAGPFAMVLAVSDLTVELLEVR